MKRAVLARSPKGAGAYVVLDEPIGGLKPAIYHCDYVLRVGEQAFFSRTRSFKKLLVVPASWVFDTAEEAKAYAVKKGRPRWCVLETKRGEPAIVRAHVREGLRESFYGSGYRYRCYVLREGTKEPEVTYGVSHHATKREAQRAAAGKIRIMLRRAEKVAREKAREIARLKRSLARLGVRT